MERKIVDQGNVPDTIVAPASGVGPAAVAIIRVSGPNTRAVLEASCGGVPEPRQAALRNIGRPAIDRGLVFWFPGPASFTGEDMAELQVHGSRAVVQAVVEAVLDIGGTRPAEAGEFAFSTIWTAISANRLRTAGSIFVKRPDMRRTP